MEYRKYYYPSKQEWIVKYRNKNDKLVPCWHFSAKVYGDFAEKIADQSIKLGKRTHNFIEKKEDYCILHCLHKGVWYEVYFDLEDYDRVIDKRWFVANHSGIYYCKMSNVNTKMHRFLMDVSDESVFIDHKDRNGLNNRKYNLRICDYYVNARNKTISKNNTSGKNGVYLHVSKGNYVARITDADGKRIEKSFSIKKHGEEAAFSLAVQARLDLEKQYDYDGE